MEWKEGNVHCLNLIMQIHLNRPDQRMRHHIWHWRRINRYRQQKVTVITARRRRSCNCDYFAFKYYRNIYIHCSKHIVRKVLIGPFANGPWRSPSWWVIYYVLCIFIYQCPFMLNDLFRGKSNYSLCQLNQPSAPIVVYLWCFKMIAFIRQTPINVD